MNVEGGGLEDAEYEVFQRGGDDTSFLLFHSAIDDLHLDMVAALEKQIEKNNAAHAKALETAEE